MTLNNLEASSAKRKCTYRVRLEFATYSRNVQTTRTQSSICLLCVIQHHCTTGQRPLPYISIILLCVPIVYNHHKERNASETETVPTSIGFTHGTVHQDVLQDEGLSHTLPCIYLQCQHEVAIKAQHAAEIY